MSLADLDNNPSGLRLSNSSTVDDGNHVATCEEFVRKFGGKRVINRILIANNGIAG